MNPSLPRADRGVRGQPVELDTGLLLASCQVSGCVAVRDHASFDLSDSNMLQDTIDVHFRP